MAVGEDAPSLESSEVQPADVDALADQLVRLARRFERARAEVATRCPGGVERAAYVLLAHLVADGPQRLSALADAVHSDPSTVSRQVTQLVQMGLVQRHPDPQDGRAAQLSATEAGRQAFAEHRRIRNQHTAAVVSGWPARDVHQLVGLLDKLNTDFEQYRTHLEGPAS
ncbi:MAG TPA: MarR family transcriptional regulator [Pseudonocardiaceae bacterium]|nr:MarR family transcriptional regulator [Pseudonocardiaceae bacterium]